MAGRYPDYDWRGIAMLTQQLGQLFEPSKARLMSQQQEHEMSMLMAKQAWKTQSENLDILKTEYNGLVTNIDTETRALQQLSLGELVNAGMKDGAMGDQAAEVLEKNDMKKLSDMQEMASKYREMIRDQKANLSNMRLYNDTAKAGAGFSKRMTSRPGAKEQKEYDVLAESDGIPGLSYKEKQQALNMYIKDADFVLKEDDKDYNTGINQQVWNGAEYENLRVKPEGVAFISGYNQTIDKEARKKAVISADKDKVDGRPSFPDMNDKMVITLFSQNNDRIQQINNKFLGQKDKGTLEQYLAWDQFGDYYAKEAARGKGWTDVEIADYVASMNRRKDTLNEIRVRPHLDIPAEKLNITHPLSYTINEADNRSTAKMFENAKISPDILYAKILMKEDDDKYRDMLSAYQDIMAGDKASTDDMRQAGLNIILQWVNE